KSIHDVLELTVTEAIQFFAQIGEQKNLSEPLDVLEEVGLGYLGLGQPLNTLSGGESQRLKLVRHLSETENAQPAFARDGLRRGERSTSNVGRPTKGDSVAIGNLFIFDEPTTGLHFDDVAMLLRLFQRLVDRGHSVVVIEHNLEVIKCADWIVDLGPEAGAAGGEVVASGTPQQIAKIDESHTGRFLREILGSVGASGAVFGMPLRKFDGVYSNDDIELARAAEEPFGVAPNGRRETRVLPEQNGAISIHGAREHNLKNIHVKIPPDQMVMITGLIGAGTSTLD